MSYETREGVVSFGSGWNEIIAEPPPSDVSAHAVVSAEAQAIVDAIRNLPQQFAEMLKQRDLEAKAATDYVKSIAEEMDTAAKALFDATETLKAKNCLTSANKVFQAHLRAKHVAAELAGT